MIDLLAEEFMSKHGINLRTDMYALEKLKLAAENAKRGLSMDDEVEIRIPDVARGDDGQSLSLDRTLTIKEFAALVNDLVLRTFKVCDEALQQAGVTTRDLEGVILVGGPTRLGIIREAVTQYFGQDPKTDVDPDEVVAMGAAIPRGVAGVGHRQRKRRLPARCHAALAQDRRGRRTRGARDRTEHPVPIEQTRTFTTYQDMQEAVRIRVFQGEGARRKTTRCSASSSSRASRHALAAR